MTSPTFLADTNVLSELARPRPDAGVLRWADGVRRIAISTVTVEELEYGLAWNPHPRIAAWLEEFMASACDIVPITEAIARRAGRLRGRLRADGVTRTQADMLIAATAQELGLTLVTRNQKDFRDCGIDQLDPFVGS